MSTNPYFSIVTPVFNREREIRRAIASCLSQTFRDFEAIVVDDGSTDNTAKVVMACADPRVRLIRSARNRGVCPARNAAIREARAEWIIYLDSDDELLPDCLSRIFETLSQGATGIGRLGFLYQFDDGRRSPFPMSSEGVLGYEDWLRFIETARLSDALWVTRRDSFEQCMLPESFAPEFKYNLDFSRRFRWRIVPHVLALEHSDSPVRLTFCSPSEDPARERQRESDRLEHWNSVLQEHGAALQFLAPHKYQAVLRARAVSYMLTGHRWRGLAAGLGCLCRHPESLVNWGLIIAALIGSGATQRARAWKSRRIALATHTAGVRQPASFCPSGGAWPEIGESRTCGN